MCCCSHSKGGSEEPQQTSPLSSSPASPRGSSAFSGHDRASAPTLGPAVRDTQSGACPKIRQGPAQEGEGTRARATLWGSPYLLQVLVGEQQVLILFLQEQQPQFVHLQKKQAPLRHHCGARALVLGGAPPCHPTGRLLEDRGLERSPVHRGVVTRVASPPAAAGLAPGRRQHPPWAPAPASPPTAPWPLSLHAGASASAGKPLPSASAGGERRC